jgi:HAD superfamily hydrolase (TIGR01544 family)
LWFKMENIIISNEENFEKIKEKFLEDDKEFIHIVADFDRTLTKVFVDSKKVNSITSILRDENYLSDDYSAKAKALFEKYHPIEIDPKIDIKVKKKAMLKWWIDAFNLMITHSLTRKDIEKAIYSGKIVLREGVKEFFNMLFENNIPIVIISSSGLGKESIEFVLKKEKIFFENVYIISNEFLWDTKGKMVGIKRPIIHVFNKDETIIKKFGFYQFIKERKNVILLGDSLGDVDMVKGFNYDALLKIGFLNEDIEKNLEVYKQNYDALLLNDSDFSFINELFQEFLNKKP